ncbi:MAG: hypothetical protein U1F34_05435 [Gammaproteobacteria bacterium]
MPPPIDGIEIERMHRLTKFQHHVIGDVNDGADRTQAAATQALLIHNGVALCALTPRIIRPM